MEELLEILFTENDFEGNYIFASAAEEVFYNKCYALSCPELFAFIVELNEGYESTQGSMVVGGATAKDYENMLSLAIAAYRDKEKAGLC